MGTACDAMPLAPGPELCGDMLDNDCDDEADEGFDVGNPCSVLCSGMQCGGTKVCAPDGAETVCQPAPGCCEGRAANDAGGCHAGPMSRLDALLALSIVIAPCAWRRARRGLGGRGGAGRRERGRGAVRHRPRAVACDVVG
jgi:hypothetical protein